MDGCQCLGGGECIGVEGAMGSSGVCVSGTACEGWQFLPLQIHTPSWPPFLLPHPPPHTPHTHKHYKHTQKHNQTKTHACVQDGTVARWDAVPPAGGSDRTQLQVCEGVRVGGCGEGSERGREGEGLKSFHTPT